MEEHVLCEWLSSISIDYIKTGSSVICDHIPNFKPNDIDYCVLVHEFDTFEIEALNNGWIKTSIDFNNLQDDGEQLESYPNDFISYRSGDYNLIVTDYEGFYHRFYAATLLAVELELCDSKEGRIEIFQQILYGK